MHNMQKTDHDMTKHWVQTWQQAEPALQEIKKQELQNYNYAKNLPIIDDMLQWAYEHRTSRKTSGLVEQQRLFMKIWEKVGTTG